VPLGFVAVELPEKQGLKRDNDEMRQMMENCCSGTSRKTRIETVEKASIICYNLLLQWNFQKNKD